ncbi:MAG: hypothetical protein KF891_07195 [Rhizobacter sp.]|nr:hypothetical protein [Rhizobacter sp.]
MTRHGGRQPAPTATPSVVRIGAMAMLAGMAFAGPRAAKAADAITDAMQAAYVPYRVALFRTNNKAGRESEQALVAARAQWQSLTQRFAASPTPPYDRDPGFAAALKQVDAVYATAGTQIAAGQLAEAHETLEKARDLMAELRRRNGVIVYSDHMNAYHEQMEHVLKAGATLLDAPGGLLELAAQAGTLDYLGRRLSSEAPESLAQEPEFKPLLDDVQASVATLRSAIARQDEAAVRLAISKIKAPYSRLFLRFG